MDTDGENKKKRSQNWESYDKLLLRQLITEKISIIENKNVDTDTSRQKRDAWKEILERFNHASTITRSLAQIQCQWRGTKMQAKLRLSQHKKNQSATEGGPLPKSPDREDVDLIALKTEEIDIDYNQFDCDNPAETVKFHIKEVAEPITGSLVGTDDTECNNVEEVPNPKRRRKNPRNETATSEQMKIDLFSVTKKAKKKEMELMEVEHRKRMEILDLEIQFKKSENDRREKEHLVRMELLAQNVM